MNKRQTKKANQKKLHNFIYNINQQHKDLREDFYQLAFYEHCREDDDDDMTDVCFCDECVIRFDHDVHHTAWGLYKEMMKECRDFERIINLGRRKIHIGLQIDGSGRSDWSFSDFSVCGKEAVFNALTEEEKTIVIMHPHFHNYQRAGAGAEPALLFYKNLQDKQKGGEYILVGILTLPQPLASSLQCSTLYNVMGWHILSKIF